MTMQTTPKLNELKRRYLFQQPSAARNRIIMTACMALLLLIGWLDNITDYEFGFFIFYFIPVAITAWFVGKRSGLFAAVAAAICWYFSDYYTEHPYSRAYFLYWDLFMRLISFITTALTITRIRQMLTNEENLNARLERTLQELTALKGMPRRCVGCPVLHDPDAVHPLNESEQPQKSVEGT
jgi:K+-sensing histidine kinase KdpD